MKVNYENSLYCKALVQIRTLPGSVVLRSDLQELGSERQISRVLKKLTINEELIKLGYGVYGKLIRAQQYPTLTYLKNGVLPTIREALTRLKVEWEPSSVEQDYNSGRSTQVPANPPTKIKSRFARKLSYDDWELRIES